MTHLNHYLKHITGKRSRIWGGYFVVTGTEKYSQGLSSATYIYTHIDLHYTFTMSILSIIPRLFGVRFGRTEMREDAQEKLEAQAYKYYNFNPKNLIIYIMVNEPQG